MASTASPQPPAPPQCIERLPTELIIEIFCNLDSINDMWSLKDTCTRLEAVYKNYRYGILTEICGRLRDIRIKEEREASLNEALAENDSNNEDGKLMKLLKLNRRSLSENGGKRKWLKKFRCNMKRIGGLLRNLNFWIFL